MLLSPILQSWGLRLSEVRLLAKGYTLIGRGVEFETRLGRSGGREGGEELYSYLSLSAEWGFPVLLLWVETLVCQK